MAEVLSFEQKFDRKQTVPLQLMVCWIVALITVSVGKLAELSGRKSTSQIMTGLNCAIGKSSLQLRS